MSLRSYHQKRSQPTHQMHQDQFPDSTLNCLLMAFVNPMSEEIFVAAHELAPNPETPVPHLRASQHQRPTPTRVDLDRVDPAGPAEPH